MRLPPLLNLNAILALAAGIAFGLYAPLMMNLYGILEAGGDSLSYWHAVSFARLFGAGLFGFGFLTLALRRLLLRAPLDRGAGSSVASAMLLAHLIGFMISITQQVSIWGTLTGWVTTGYFLLLMLAYAIALIKPDQGN